MDRLARKGLVTAMVAGGVLASAGYAQADAAAGGDAAGSPGVLSGNSVQVPVHVPVNVCGNTIDVIGLLDPAAGNACTNASGAPDTACPPGAPDRAVPAQQADTTRRGRHAGAVAAETTGYGSRSGGGAHAAGAARHSPGLLSGNSVRVPVDLPVNVVGNSVDVAGLGNSAAGNTGVNRGAPPRHVAPPAAVPVAVPVAARPVPVPHAAPMLAHTGADGLGWAGAGSVSTLLAGASLYRRFRPGRG